MNVIVAPLNWGLGHATRCVPIVKALLAQGATPILASDGASLALLKQEFPQLETIELPSYNIKYAKKGGFHLAFKMLFQLPKILNAIILEYFFIRNYCKKKEIQILISDNRFGLFGSPPPVYRIFLTHQLQIQTPFGWTTYFVNLVNHFFLKKFDEIWIPDFSDEPNLSGKLSHHQFPSKISQKINYIEPLSRFSRAQEGQEKQYDLTIVLSGIEPQRTILENKIWQQLEKMTTPQYPDPKIAFVRGTTALNPNLPTNHKNIEIYQLLNGEKLQSIVSQSAIVLSRSGYSSLMDWAALNVPKMILIPTPGQTEQEYLAHYFALQNRCFAQSQADFNLENALLLLQNQATQPPFRSSNDLILHQKITKILQSTVSKISKNKH